MPTNARTMPDETACRTGHDHERINVHRYDELAEWARRFEVTPQRIREAAQAVGTRTRAVAMHLQRADGGARA